MAGVSGRWPGQLRRWASRLLVEMNAEAKPDFSMLIESIAKRPAMYLGNASLQSIGHYLAGYCDALRDVGVSASEIEGFIVWLSEKFLIFHPAWHWTRILLHIYQGDEAAIKALPDLFAEYLQTKGGRTLAQLEFDRDIALMATYGKTSGAPADTRTTAIS